MISWMRAARLRAPSWIGFVAYGYASQTPIYNDATQNPSAVDASPTAFDSRRRQRRHRPPRLHGRCTNTDPACEGRQYNGMIYPSPRRAVR